ncbi:hypothetical protein GC194_01795 [bacterium]|nr:hypothetical protein [bacterium]
MMLTTINNIFEFFKPMHMKRINADLRKIFLLTLFSLAAAFSLRAQTFEIDEKSEGCEEYLVTFRFTGTTDSLNLYVGGKKVVTTTSWNHSGNTWTIQYFLKAGKYNPYVEYWDGSKMVALPLAQPITVYENPKASFTITNDTSQCFEANQFCFKSLAAPGKEGHKITKVFYDLGDGVSKNVPDFCYSYKQSGNFDITYIVTDEKGCANSVTIKDYPEVYKQLGVKFKLQDVNGGAPKVGCPKTTIRFINETSLDPSKIDHWTWDWGTGGKKSKETFYYPADYPDHWTNFTRSYSKDGFKSPQLTVVANDGCRDSFLLKNAIRVINFYFDIVWIPDTPCFTDNNITFNMPPRPNATQWLWTFGDPNSQQLNFNRASWSPSHHYVGGPGFYNVSLSITEPPCPAKDTTMCYVKLKGPGAAINLPSPPFPSNQCVDPREIPRADFERIAYDECYRANSGITSIDFTIVNSKGTDMRGSYFEYCNPVIDSYQYVLGAAGDGSQSCGPNFTFAKKNGWVSKPIFKQVYIDSLNNRWKVTKENFRESGVTKFLTPGDTAFYDNTYFVAKDSGFYHFYCDSFLFHKGDSIPRNTVVLDSIAIYEAPIGTIILATKPAYYNNIKFERVGADLYLNKGETVKYYYKGSYQTYTATTSGIVNIKADSIYFNTGDTIRMPNGVWHDRIQHFTQTYRPTWNYNDPIPAKDSLRIVDSLIPVGGGLKIRDTFWVYQPFMRLHQVEIKGKSYIYRITSSPIKTVGGTYYPPMYPGTTPPVDGCGDEWRTMHDSDKFNWHCSAPNLVSFTNNSSKYRLFGSKESEIPMYGNYAWDNSSARFYGDQVANVDACNDNPNFPWASDSLLYLWDFGDNSDQCTTYFDTSANMIMARGQNPSGDVLQCKFSTLVAPQHLYTENGCWTAILKVVDPEAGCDATAQQPIVMEEPDGGPADPLGFMTPEDVNWYNQVTIQKDEANNDFRRGVEIGRSGAPCVKNQTNPYYQNIDISKTIPLCGRQTYWMIFSRDPNPDATNGQDDSQCDRVDCSIDGNGKIVKKVIESRGSLHNPGAYDVEWREVKGPGVLGDRVAKGRAVINSLGFLVKVNVNEQNGKLKNNGKAQMVFKDSSKLGFGAGKDSILVYGYEQVDSFYYSCGWIPQLIIEMILSNRWQYTTPGCKTPGIVIKAGDCFDTFYYENYRYFLDANADFMISPNPRTHKIEERSIRYAKATALPDSASRATVRKLTRYDIVNELIDKKILQHKPKGNLLPTKLPYQVTFSVDDYSRNDPNEYGADPVCGAADSLRTFMYYVAQTAGQCGYINRAAYNDSLYHQPRGYGLIRVWGDSIFAGRDTFVMKPDPNNSGQYLADTFDVNSIKKVKSGRDSIPGPGFATIVIDKFGGLLINSSVDKYTYGTKTTSIDNNRIVIKRDNSSFFHDTVFVERAKELHKVNSVYEVTPKTPLVDNKYLNYSIAIKDTLDPSLLKDLKKYVKLKNARFIINKMDLKKIKSIVSFSRTDSFFVYGKDSVEFTLDYINTMIKPWNGTNIIRNRDYWIGRKFLNVSKPQDSFYVYGKNYLRLDFDDPSILKKVGRKRSNGSNKHKRLLLFTQDTMVVHKDIKSPPQPYDRGVFLIALKDTFYVLDGRHDTLLTNLRDTIHYDIRVPGKYLVTSTSKAQHGNKYCYGGANKEIWVGQHQCFRYTDSVICDSAEVCFTDSVYYWHPFGQIYCELLPWPDNTTCIDTNIYFYSPKGAVSRATWQKDPTYTLPEYTEMIAYDFNSQRWVKNAKGEDSLFVVKKHFKNSQGVREDSLDINGNKVYAKRRMQDWMRVLDSNDIEKWINPADSSFAYQTRVWQKDAKGNSLSRDVCFTYGTTPEFGVGIYNVTLWARDSLGCWIPHTYEDAIRVVGVKARFTLCDTCSDTLVCTPATIAFKDTSVVLENKDDNPAGEAVRKGKLDEIIKWTWKFGDRRDSSLTRNPVHTYLDPKENGYTIRLFVETKQGCKDSIKLTKGLRIVVIGPKAGFSLVNDSICVNDSIYLYDQTETKQTANSIWTVDPSGVTVNSNVKKRDTVGIMFKQPGDYEISLRVRGKVNDPVTGIVRDCVDKYPNPDAGEEKPAKVYVRGIDTLTIDPSDWVICPDDEVVFNISEDSTYKGYKEMYWTLALKDSTFSYTLPRGSEVRQVFPDSGKYTVKLSGSGKWPICPTEDSVVITVKRVEANVKIDPRSNEDLANYVFLNKSVNGSYFRWRIYQYPDTTNAIYEEVRKDTSRLEYKGFTNGDYKVELLVADYPDPNDSRACIDIDFVKIKVNPLIKFYNTITPDNDTKNDWWEVEMQVVPEYEFAIYNRWGEVMMKGTQEDVVDCYYKESTGSTVCKFWNGKNMNDGSDVLSGTYFYVFKYRFKGDAELTQVNGSITVVR